MNEARVAGEIADGFAAAWNDHDMTALGRLFHDDGDFVNVIGTHMRGRESIERQHGVAHAGPLRNSHSGSRSRMHARSCPAWSSPTCSPSSQVTNGLLGRFDRRA